MRRFSIILFLLLFSLSFTPVQSVYSQAIFSQGDYKFSYKGNWSSTAVYSGGDIVLGTDGISYVATEDTIPVGTDPVGATRYWGNLGTIVVPVGPRGQQGPIGLTGPAGADGADGTDGAVGPRGPIGTTGPQGLQGLQGPRGLQGPTGIAGAAGLDGYSTRFIYRKISVFDYNQPPPSVTYDGTRPANSTSLTIPSQWSLNPYVSQMYDTGTATGITNGRDIVVDPDSDIIYVMQLGSVYRYNFDGTPANTNPNWNLNSGNAFPVSLAISGSRLYVLDTANADPNPLNPYLNYIYVYNKEDGGFQTRLSVTTPLNHPQPRAITIDGSNIFLVSAILASTNITTKAIRVLNLQGVEQIALGRDVLPNANDNPVAIGSTDSFLYVLDGTDDQVYVYGRSDPERRYTSLEFNLGVDSTGIALSEFTLFTLMNNTIHRFYNPQNTLWSSALFIQEDNPFDVTESNVFWMTARRTIGSAGETVVISGGGGGAGTAGSNGDSVTFIFREVMLGGTAPTTPPRTEGSYVGGNFNTAPNDWHLTAAAAEAHLTGVGDLYFSVVKLDGDGSTIISYGNPVKITGPRGPPGNSTTFIYQAVLSTDSAPGVPSGGEWEGNEPRSFNLPTLNRGWSKTPPLRLAAGEVLYLSEVTLPGSGTDHRGSITYKPAFSIPRGEQGDQGIQGPPGPQGADSTVAGPAGIGFTIIFREAMNEPSTVSYTHLTLPTTPYV